MEIEWKNIEEANLYMISNQGQVKSLSKILRSREGYRTTKERILKPDLRNGYLAVSLSLSSNNYKKFNIHRLVAKYFVENFENKDFVNHIDGNKLNNNFINLEWVTHSENVKHAYDNNLLKPACNRKGFTGKYVHNSKPVNQYNLKGEFIKYYESCSLTKADGFTPSCVARCLTGELKQHKGFLWKAELTPV